MTVITLILMLFILIVVIPLLGLCGQLCVGVVAILIAVSTNGTFHLMCGIFVSVIV